ncbi:unnamed protein product, partial [marine sediment metagenome]
PKQPYNIDIDRNSRKTLEKFGFYLTAAKA